MNGRFIVFEGVDGAGKSSICNDFAIALRERGLATDLLGFPGNEVGTLGHLVYRLHHDPHAFDVMSLTPGSLQTLHIAAHLDALETTIIPLLTSGKCVILDRYWWSTWVYGKTNGMRRDVLDALIHVERTAWEKWRPAIVYYVTRQKPLREEPLDKWQRLKASYEELIAVETGAYPIHVLHNDGDLKSTVQDALWHIPFDAS
jgi:dTMP kinase